MRGARIHENIVGPQERLVMVVGNYGSGKTEVCVNLAIAVAGTGRQVQIADLDIVNPYFRCREARQLMERHGIRVVAPAGAQAWADLPIVLPEIRGMLRPPDGTLTIFDVGGDDVGARVLASLKTSIGDCELWQVINSKRPFTDTLEGCLEMRRAVEESSRLKVTGLVANSHLVDQTTPEVVIEGWRLSQRVAESAGIPVRCVALMRELADASSLRDIDTPLLRMQRHMLPPWLHPSTGEDADLETAGVPAAPPQPIGKPGPMRFSGTGKERDGQDRD